MFGVPIEFVLFGATLLGVVICHGRAFTVALTGLTVITAYLMIAAGLDPVTHLEHEAPALLNLLGLLVGFAVLAGHFTASGAAQTLPSLLPPGMAGAFLLLATVFVMSSFLDNIAAALIGGAMTRALYGNRVHVGFLAAIVAASNAGGSGSVIGDTTTTMIWIAGHDASDVVHAYLGAIPGFACFALAAALQQRHHRPEPAAATSYHIDKGRLVVVAAILIGAIAANLLIGLPAAGVWLVILITATYRRPAWHEVPAALKGAGFLLCLVLCASLMPVDRLPPPSWQSNLELGFVSSVFDNIPLTALALRQGGHDWGVLAYSVGCGGSLMWFGSSAGVALSVNFPEMRSTIAWLKSGWHVPVGFLLGFGALLLLNGWHAS